jgi:hypothetical protein
MDALHEASDQLADWFTTAEAAYAQHSELDHVTETLAQRFADEVVDDPDDPEAARRLALLSGYESNAMGLVRYLDLRDEGRVAT